jgi:hypothetical protein
MSDERDDIRNWLSGDLLRMFDRWLITHDAEIRADQIEKDAQWILVVATETAKAQRESDLSEGIKPIGTSTPLEAEWYQYGNWAAAAVRAQPNEGETP